MSHMTTGRTGDGMTVASAGRATPLMRPITNVPAARQAPVDPAEKKPCAAPSFTRRQPTTMDESFFLRTAFAGCSAMAMTSLHACGVQRSWAAANGSTTSAGPHRTISRAGSEASAWATPSSTTPGASSPPMASTATTTFSSDISKTSLSRIGQREALRYLILRQRRRGTAPTPSRKHASIREEETRKGKIRCIKASQCRAVPPFAERRNARKASRRIAREARCARRLVNARRQNARA